MTIKKARTPKVYLVTTPTGPRLVRALSIQSAVKWAVLDTHAARVATQEDLLANRALDVADATADADEEVPA